MQNLNCLNQVAQSSVLASVAIAVAAASSGNISPSNTPVGYGPLSDEHSIYLGRSGFPDEYLDQADIFSACEGDGFAIRFPGVGLITYVATKPGQYACTSPVSFFAPPVQQRSNEAFFASPDHLYVTNSPLEAILASVLGIRSIAIDPNAWIAPDVPMPLPGDRIHRTLAARPDDRLLDLARNCLVVLADSLSGSILGHALLYHVKCRIRTMPAGGTRLPPAVLADCDYEKFQEATRAFERLYVRYVFEQNEDRSMAYHYPIVYRASDTFVPPVEKDKFVARKDKDGNEEWQRERVPLHGVPNCRVRETLIVTKAEGGIISLDRNAGSAKVIEVMEGVTTTRREVSWQQQPTDYDVDSFIGRDFTKVLANQLPDLRALLAAQKGLPGHPIAFGTEAKGFFGLRHPGGETVFPAGFITEDRVVTQPGGPTIVPLGAKAGALSRKGTPQAWRKIMRIVLRNPSIAALMGFSASILIHPWVPGTETGMIVLVGASGRGKTTAMRAIASMISEPSKPSKPGSYIMSFRTTDNGLEGRLEAKNHCFSLIDEVGASSSAMNFTALVYMIANGIGRLRMNADSTARETKTWTTQTIATGEESIASKINASGQAERGGILFRVIDLHLEGVPFWEHLEAQVRDGSTGEYQPICDEYGPASVTPTQVMDTVFAGLEQHHGHAWWGMVERMLEDEYRQKAADRLVAWKKTFTAKLDDRTEIIVHRRSIHLASAMAGLELILDTLGDELPAAERQSIIDGAAAWVENHLWRAGLPEGVVTEESALYERVIEKIAMNPGRFYYPASDEKPRSFKEYWGVNYGGCGVTIFIAGLKDMCAEMGEDYKRVRHALVSQSDDKKWTESNNRPAPGAAPMRGLCSPETFRLLGYGYRA